MLWYFIACNIFFVVHMVCFEFFNYNFNVFMLAVSTEMGYN